MKKLLAAAAVFVLILGIVICPRPPSKSTIDPTALLADTRGRQKSACYKSSRICARLRNGKMRENREYVTNPGAFDPWLTALVPRQMSPDFTPLVESEDVIVGRPTWLLRLKPRLKHRLWRQLWIDKETHVVLAVRDWTGGNTIQDSMKTVMITYR